MTHRRVLLGLALLVLAGLLYRWHSFAHERYLSEHILGPIQVVGNERELWVFLQVDRQVIRPSRYEHRALVMGNSQEVVKFSLLGLSERVKVATENGPVFHPNLARVFVAQNAVCILMGPSRDSGVSLGVWEGDHFQVVPDEERDALLTKNGLSHSLTWASMDRLLDRATEQNGWQHLYASDWAAYEHTFLWNGMRVRVEGMDVADGLSVRVSCDQLPGFQPATLAWPKSRTQLSREEYGMLWARLERGRGTDR